MINRILIVSLFWAMACPIFAQPNEIPNAQPGKCYAKCFIPDKFEVVTDQIMIRPPSSENVAVPAKFEMITAYYVSKEAYTRLVVEPAVFETLTEKIMVTPGGKRLPASAYDTIRETILLKPAAKKYQVEEAVFETVQASVVVEEAYAILEVIPQQYEQVLDRVEIKPAVTRWVRKKAERDCLGADPDDCFVWCMVEEPAQYQTLYKQVARGCDGAGSDDCARTTPVAAKTVNMPLLKLKSPAKAVEGMSPAEQQIITKIVLKAGVAAPDGNEPAEYVTVTRQVLKKPARVREEWVPAEYKTIQRKAVMTPATLAVDPLPAEFTPVLKRKLIRKGGFTEWREILCGEKITGYTISQIQDALKALGYYKGAPETTLGPRTKTALAQFQKERDLPADGNIDFETLQALGIRN